MKAPQLEMSSMMNHAMMTVTSSQMICFLFSLMKALAFFIISITSFFLVYYGCNIVFGV